MGLQQRLYRNVLNGPRRLVGWCDSCGFLAEARVGQDEALAARLDRHRLCAHGSVAAQPGGGSSSDEGVAVVRERSLLPA